MSTQRQEELTEMLEQVLALPVVQELHPDAPIRRMHFDWLAAGEHTQRTVAYLSQQLRRFLDDKVWLENKRIMEILRSIEASAIAVRDKQPVGEFATVPDLAAEMELPMERTLYTPPLRTTLTSAPLVAPDEQIDDSLLFAQSSVDWGKLAENIRTALLTSKQITLAALCREHPLQYGMAELIAYLQLASTRFPSVVDETTQEVIRWTSEDGAVREARMPRVVFVS